MTTSVIYLDNLSEKLTPWTPNDDNHLYAIVDMGSNGIRFSITSLAPPTTRLLRPVYSSRAPISLFDALTPRSAGSSELVFPPETITTTATALGHFHRLAVLHGVPAEHIMVLATEAMRRAANATDMLDAIGNATQGLGVSILNPDVETLCGAVMGSRSGLVSVDRGALFLDLGGGSVQMTWVDTSQEGYEIAAAQAGRSLPFGAARLSRVLQDETQDTQTATISQLQSGLRDAYEKLCSQFPALQAIRKAHENGEKGHHTLVDVYMCGGGFRGYGSMLMHNDPIDPYPISSAAGYTAPGTLFKQTEKMRRVNEEYDGKIFGLSKRRRAQFPAIVTVVDAFVAAVPNIRQVTFCAGSNREGALMMKLPREVRESNPLEALAAVTAEEQPIFDAIIQKLSDALPKEANFNGIPTILNSSLGPLFVRDIWIRQGYDDDVNTSFALNRAVTGHFDAPGLSHLARALLAVTGAARWGGSLGPIDAQLYQGLVGILQAQHEDAPFWAAYIGAVARVIAMALPVCPKDPVDLNEAIRIEARLQKSEDKKDKVTLTIGVASDNTTGINLVDLADKIQGTAKKIGGQRPKIKISAQVNVLS